jgi:hypothetical protein
LCFLIFAVCSIIVEGMQNLKSTGTELLRRHKRPHLLSSKPNKQTQFQPHCVFSSTWPWLVDRYQRTGSTCSPVRTRSISRLQFRGNVFIFPCLLKTGKREIFPIETGKTGNKPGNHKIPVNILLL